MDTTVPRVAKYSRPVHILFVGAGAVGCFYASRLHSPESNIFVSLVCRSNYDAIVQNGGSVVMQTRNFGDYTFTPSAVYPSIKAAAEAGRVAAMNPSGTRKHQGWDYVFVTTKALPDVTDDARDIEPLVRLAPEGRTCIVLIQNGVGIEEPHRRRFPLNPIVTAVTIVNAEQISQGVIRQNRWTRLSMGPYSDGLGGKSGTARILGDRGTAATRQLVTLFAEPGKLRDAEEHDEIGILLVRWHKICINAAMNPSAVLSGGLPSSDMVLDTEIRTHLRGVMEEVFDAAPAILGRSFPPNLASAERILRSTERNTGGRPSMLVDWQSGRPLELEVILGNPVRIARRHGVDMQRTQTMYALLKSAQIVRDSLAAAHKGTAGLIGLGQPPAPDQAQTQAPAQIVRSIPGPVGPFVDTVATTTEVVNIPTTKLQAPTPPVQDSSPVQPPKKTTDDTSSPPPSIGSDTTAITVTSPHAHTALPSTPLEVSTPRNNPLPRMVNVQSHASPDSSTSPTEQKVDRTPQPQSSIKKSDESTSHFSAIDKLEEDLKRGRKLGFAAVKTHSRSFDQVGDREEDTKARNFNSSIDRAPEKFKAKVEDDDSDLGLDSSGFTSVQTSQNPSQPKLDLTDKKIDTTSDSHRHNFVTGDLVDEHDSEGDIHYDTNTKDSSFEDRSPPSFAAKSSPQTVSKPTGSNDLLQASPYVDLHSEEHDNFLSDSESENELDESLEKTSSLPRDKLEDNHKGAVSHQDEPFRDTNDKIGHSKSDTEHNRVEGGSDRNHHRSSSTSSISSISSSHNPSAIPQRQSDIQYVDDDILVAEAVDRSNPTLNNIITPEDKSVHGVGVLGGGLGGAAVGGGKDPRGGLLDKRVDEDYSDSEDEMTRRRERRRRVLVKSKL